MPSPTICSAKALYKKASGLLELSQSHLRWTRDGKKAPELEVPCSTASSLLCSKEGAAQVKLKLGVVGNDAGFNFTFTSPQAVALSEREKFKAELIALISRNRAGAEAVPAPHAPSAKALESHKIPPPTTPVPRPPHLVASRASTSRAASVARDSRNGTPSADQMAEFRLRKKVLLSTPELASLHRELVMSGQITETEFWEGREHLISTQAAAERQKKGKPGQLVDPRPQTVDGETKMVITPQLVHDIFEEYPVVARAYSENVPNKVNEADFWSRYFQSKLFNAHRASIRSSAAQHVVKDDKIFDKYLEKDDDELEPRRLREGGVDMFIDLGATQEDHVETGNDKDITMQAGKQRAVLPLIRKFNEHSGRLLDTVLGGPPAKRRRVDSANGQDRYAELDLEDLHDTQTSAGIILDMQNSQRYFEGGMSSTSKDVLEEKPDFRAVLMETKDSLKHWSSNLSQLKIERKAGESAFLGMTQNVSARLDVKSRKNDIPDGLFRQMTTCQTAANEFLRQFWLTAYPPPTEGNILATATPAQKAAKMAKMAGYLSRTHEKVDALIRVARQEGFDSARIDIAMKPLLNAVDRALEFWRTRSAKFQR